MECKHDKIQVIRQGRSYVWSCSLCGRSVWKTIGLDPLKEGEGFRFRITEKGAERESDKVLVA